MLVSNYYRINQKKKDANFGTVPFLATGYIIRVAKNGIPLYVKLRLQNWKEVKLTGGHQWLCAMNKFENWTVDYP